MASYFAEDGANLPFASVTYPSALYVASTDTTWIVRETFRPGGRGIRIISYDHAAGEWGPDRAVATHPLVDDAHGVPSIARDADGYLHVFGGAHASDLFEWVSGSPDDASSFTLRTTFSTGDYTYPHPMLVGSDLWLILRKTDSPNTKMPAVFYKTTSITAGVPTWGSETALVDFGADSRVYVGATALDGTGLHFVATRADFADSIRQDIYHFILDTTTGDVTNADGTQTIAAASLPVDLTEADADFRVIDTGTDRTDIPGFVLDSSGNPHIAYGQGAGNDLNVFHTMFSGGSWSSPVDTGANIHQPASAGFVDEIALVSAGAGVVHLYYPEDDAGSWNHGGDMGRVIRSSGGSWGSPSVILSATSYALGRPVAVLNGDAEMRVVFAENLGTVENDGQGGDLKCYAYGDSGLVARTVDPLLTRTTAGLLDQYNLGEADARSVFATGDWTAGSGNSLGLVSGTNAGALQIRRSGTGSDARGFVRLDTVASRSEAVVFARILVQGSNRFGVAAHINDLTAASEDGIDIALPGGFSSSAHMVEWVNATATVLDDLAGQNAGAGPHNFWFHPNGTALAGWDSFTNRDWAGTAATHASGQVGAWRSGSSTQEIHVLSFFVSTGRYLTVTGLTTGDTIEGRGWDHTVVVSGSESGGSATLDIAKISPTSIAEIVVVRGGSDLTVFQRPRGEVFIGGDVWELGAAPVQADTITATATSPTTIDIGITENDASVTGRTLHRSTTPGFTPGAGNQIADLGADPSGPYGDTGLTPGTTYYYKTVVTDGVDSATSNEASATTFAVGTAPTLSATVTGATTASLAVEPDLVKTAISIQFQTQVAGGDWSSPVDDSTVAAEQSEQTILDLEGLTTDTTYEARARRIYADGNSDWSNTVTFTPTAESGGGFPGEEGTTGFVSPIFGEVIAGVAYTVEWVAVAGETATLDISDDLGSTWTTLVSATSATTFALDTTAYTDGSDFVLRLTFSGGGVVYVYGFRIDNAGGTFDYLEEGDQALEDFGVLWDTSRSWSTKYGYPALIFPHSQNLSLLAPNAVPECVAADVMVRGIFWNGGGGFSWNRYAASENNGMGIGIVGRGTNTSQDVVGIWAGLRTDQLIWPFGDCETTRGTTDGNLAVFASSIERNAVTGTLGFATADELDTHVNVGTVFVVASDCGRRRPVYEVRLRVNHPDRISFPNRVRIRAHTSGPGLDPAVGADYWQIDETVDFDQEFDCGLIGYAGHAFGSRTNAVVEFLSMSVDVTDETCDYPPEPEVPCPAPDYEDDQPPFPDEECAVWLGVYEPDRVTLAWEVATSHSVVGFGNVQPYLEEPEHYGEQEVDFAEGKASITQARAAVIDKRRTSTDQDTGWVTFRLADVSKRNAIFGRRCRLLRWVDDVVGWVVIADGPAGPPRMVPEYAGFEFDIRDSRENERKTRIFGDVVEPDICLPCSPPRVALMPRGLTSPWGHVSDDVNGNPIYVVQAKTGVDATYDRSGSFVAGIGYQVNRAITFDDVVENPFLGLWLAPEWATLSTPLRHAGEASNISPIGTDSGGSTIYRIEWHLELWWRLPGATEWNVESMYQQTTDPGTSSVYPAVVKTGYVRTHFDDNGDPVYQQFDVVAGFPVFQALGTDSGAAEPADGAALEVMVVWAGPPGKYTPLLIECEAGQLLRELYDGVYSPRHPLTGEIIPTGIRYDPAALDAMTELVRLRITEPVNDLRKWTEEEIFKPLGYAPALDNDGRISPIHQSPPFDLSGLTVLDDTVVEPSPDWSAGEDVVNLLRFAYPRDHLWSWDDPEMKNEAFDGLALDPPWVRLEYRNEESIEQFGEEVWEVEGIAFRALGVSTGAARGDLEDEQGYQLAQDRRLRLFDRLKFGAPIARLTCRRLITALLRAGDWVRVRPSWLPDYESRARGLDAYAQILAIADLDCSWRRLTVELAAEEISDAAMGEFVVLAPTEVTAMEGYPNEVIVSFTARETQAQHIVFRKYRSPGGLWTDPDWTPVTTLPAGADTYADEDVEADATYFYHIIAELGGNFSVPAPTDDIDDPDAVSVTLSPATGDDVTAPSDPGSFAVAAVGSSIVRATWTPSTDDFGVAHYEVYGGTSANPTTRIGTVDHVAGAASYSFDWPGRSAETEYFVRIRAVDTSGNLSGYVEDSATTEAAQSGEFNEPSGMTAKFDIDPVGDGQWLYASGNYTYTSDATAPFSPSAVVRFNYQTGFTGGAAPGVLVAEYGGPSGDPNKYNRAYLRYWAKYSANWQGHDSGVNKQVFLSIRHSNNQYVGKCVVSGTGADSGTLTPQLRLQDLEVGSSARNLSNNKASRTITRGQWHRYEVEIIGNTPGVADGVVRLWFDGTLLAEYFDVGWMGSGGPAVCDIVNVKFNPTWGGGGDTVVETQYLYFDHMYGSGAVI